MVRPTKQTAVSLERILAVCDTYYAKHGYVVWTEVAKTFGLSRQAIQIRLNKAVESGLIDQDLVEKYRSTASRRAAARERRQTVRMLTRTIQLTPENHEWVEKETKRRGTQLTDILNGLITRAREADQ